MEESSPLTQQILEIMYATEVSKIHATPPCCNEPHPQDGFVQPAEDVVEDDPGVVAVEDEQNYGYEEYEDEQEEY